MEVLLETLSFSAVSELVCQPEREVPVEADADSECLGAMQALTSLLQEEQLEILAPWSTFLHFEVSNGAENHHLRPRSLA